MGDGDGCGTRAGAGRNTAEGRGAAHGGYPAVDAANNVRAAAVDKLVGNGTADRVASRRLKWAAELGITREFGAEILDEDQASCTLQLTGRVKDVDAFVVVAADIGEISAVARSGTVAVSKGEVTLTSFDRQHLLAG